MQNKRSVGQLLVGFNNRGNYQLSTLLLGGSKNSQIKANKNIPHSQFVSSPQLIKQYGFWNDSDRDNYLNAFDCYPFDKTRHQTIPQQLQQYRPKIPATLAQMQQGKQGMSQVQERPPTQQEIDDYVTQQRKQYASQATQQIDNELNKVQSTINSLKSARQDAVNRNQNDRVDNLDRELMQFQDMYSNLQEVKSMASSGEYETSSLIGYAYTKAEARYMRAEERARLSKEIKPFIVNVEEIPAQKIKIEKAYSLPRDYSEPSKAQTKSTLSYVSPTLKVDTSNILTKKEPTIEYTDQPTIYDMPEMRTITPPTSTRGTILDYNYKNRTGRITTQLQEDTKSYTPSIYEQAEAFTIGLSPLQQSVGASYFTDKKLQSEINRLMQEGSYNPVARVKLLRLLKRQELEYDNLIKEANRKQVESYNIGNKFDKLNSDYQKNIIDYNTYLKERKNLVKDLENKGFIVRDDEEGIRFEHPIFNKIKSEETYGRKTLIGIGKIGAESMGSEKNILGLTSKQTYLGLVGSYQALQTAIEFKALSGAVNLVSGAANTIFKGTGIIEKATRIFQKQPLKVVSKVGIGSLGASYAISGGISEYQKNKDIELAIAMGTGRATGLILPYAGEKARTFIKEEFKPNIQRVKINEPYPSSGLVKSEGKNEMFPETLRRTKGGKVVEVSKSAMVSAGEVTSPGSTVIVTNRFRTRFGLKPIYQPQNVKIAKESPISRIIPDYSKLPREFKPVSRVESLEGYRKAYDYLIKKGYSPYQARILLRTYKPQDIQFAFGGIGTVKIGDKTIVSATGKIASKNVPKTIETESPTLIYEIKPSKVKIDKIQVKGKEISKVGKEEELGERTLYDLLVKKTSPSGKIKTFREISELKKISSIENIESGSSITGYAEESTSKQLFPKRKGFIESESRLTVLSPKIRKIRKLDLDRGTYGIEVPGKGEIEFSFREELPKPPRQVSKGKSYLESLYGKQVPVNNIVTKSIKTKVTPPKSTVTKVIEQPAEQLPGIISESKYQGRGIQYEKTEGGMFPGAMASSEEQLGSRLITSNILNMQMKQNIQLDKQMQQKMSVNALGVVNLNKLTELNKLNENVIQEQRMNLKQIQEQKILQKQETQKSIVSNFMFPGERVVPKQPTTREIPKVGIPGIPGIPEFDWGKKKKQEGKAYDVYYYQDATKGLKSKWIKLNTKPMTERTAESTGAEFVDNNISAKFKVVQLQKNVAGSIDQATNYLDTFRDKFRKYRVVKGKPYPSESYIEKSKYRLDRGGEVGKIQAEKRRQRKTPFGF